MSEPPPIQELRRRLAELGCPLGPARRIVRENADHFEDLRQAALACGLTETAALAQAKEQLGQPTALADRHVAMLQAASWWGRHPRLGFVLVPLVATPVLWMLFWVAVIFLSLLVGRTELQLYFDAPIQFGVMLAGVTLGNYLVMGLIAALYNRFARRAALDFKWTVRACVLCSLYALFFHVKLEPHAFMLGIYGAVNHWYVPSVGSNWREASVPLLVLLMAYAHRQRTEAWLARPE